MNPFAPSVCDFIFELPHTSVESYARLWQQHAFHFFRMIRRPHVPQTVPVPDIYTAAIVCTAAAVRSYSKYHDRAVQRKR